MIGRKEKTKKLFEVKPGRINRKESRNEGEEKKGVRKSVRKKEKEKLEI